MTGQNGQTPGQNAIVGHGTYVKVTRHNPVRSGQTVHNKYYLSRQFKRQHHTSAWYTLTVNVRV